jgi:hypothetical protein
VNGAGELHPPHSGVLKADPSREVAIDQAVVILKALEDERDDRRDELARDVRGAFDDTDLVSHIDC